MSFKNYYESVQQTFNFRIKTIYALDDEGMDVIERVLEKYRPTKTTRPKKMMFQTHPLGFTGVKNVEVYFIDVELSVPATSAILNYDLRTAFGLHQDSEIITVCGENDDPIADQEEAREELAKDETPLLCQPNYEEIEQPNPEESFGDAYNKSFLAYVRKVEAERELNKKVDAPHPITNWEKQPDPTADIDTKNFNDDRNDTPSPISGKKGK